ncbi:MAG TPA: LemA family protein [Actinomycetota bacterium]|nr:LemA family protein [Actinomycetota bacterium]
MWLWIAVAVLVLIVLWAAWTFNRLITYRNRVDEGWSQIDVQLRRRYDLIPNLVEVVRGYADHERQTFERVTAARAAAIDASGVAGQADAETAVTAGLRQLLGVVEAYPELKADRSFLALQEELTATESKIAYARQYYNDQVRGLNTRIQRFPSLLVARAAGIREREFFAIDDPEARGPVQVGLGEPGA